MNYIFMRKNKEYKSMYDSSWQKHVTRIPPLLADVFICLQSFVYHIATATFYLWDWNLPWWSGVRLCAEELMHSCIVAASCACFTMCLQMSFSFYQICCNIWNKKHALMAQNIYIDTHTHTHTHTNIKKHKKKSKDFSSDTTPTGECQLQDKLPCLMCVNRS